MKIADRKVIVTGGASGLGLAFATHLAREGARVWALDRDEAALDAARQETGDLDRLSFESCDVGRENDVVGTVERLERESGGLEILINNAALLRDRSLVSKLGGKLKKYALADWEESIRSNLTGAFLMAREVAAALVAGRRGGLIVNISSVSRHGNPGQSAYAASKAGIDALTATWARELAPHNIRVVAIAPGFVPTSMTRTIPPLFLEQIREKTPLKRFGTLAEFTQTIQYVIENDYLNGTVLEVDGGLRL